MSETITIDDIIYTIDDPVSIPYAYVDDTNGEAITVANIESSVTINGTDYPVTSIGASAFYQCQGLTSVTIPDYVTSIGYAAFSLCQGLTSVTIPDSVTSIDGEAFYACIALTSIDILGDSVSIGINCFRSCNVLASIRFQRNIDLSYNSVLGDTVFGPSSTDDDLSGLTTIYMYDNSFNGYYYTKTFASAATNMEKTDAIHYFDTYNTPNGDTTDYIDNGWKINYENKSGYKVDISGTITDLDDIFLQKIHFADESDISLNSNQIPGYQTMTGIKSMVGGNSQDLSDRYVKLDASSHYGGPPIYYKITVSNSGTDVITNLTDIFAEPTTG